MLQRAVASAGVTIVANATPSMTDAAEKIAGRRGMPAALGRSFRDGLRRIGAAQRFEMIEGHSAPAACVDEMRREPGSRLPHSRIAADGCSTAF
jgi:hypothetical protein